MYFAYLGHYTMALVVPAIIGFLIWFIQGEEEVCYSLYGSNTIGHVHGIIELVHALLTFKGRHVLIY